MALAHGVGTEDTTFYPHEDDMGENLLQRLITELFRPLLARFLAMQGVQAFVGADQFIYWVRGNNKKVLAPDVYVMPGVTVQGEPPDCWKLWEAGNAPSFVLEVMSRDGRKDVEESPARCDEMGVEELIVYDPLVDVISGRTRFRVHRRGEDGRLALVEATNADRVRSEVLGCFLRVVGEGISLRLRIGMEPAGDELFPTEAEAERARAEAAEAENAKLRAEIERLRGTGR
jgi:hypothetical protein